MNYLQYVANVVWKHLFGKPADNLERSTENEDECKRDSIDSTSSTTRSNHHPHRYLMILSTDMIHEFTAITNSFVSVPADMGHFNCASFLAGIIAGVLDSARFVSPRL